MLFDSYDPFTFMVILLFIYFMLLLFISIIIYNIIHRNKQNTNTNATESGSNIPLTTCINCIPKPTPLPGNQQFY
jgi:hypothetical protein